MRGPDLLLGQARGCLALESRLPMMPPSPALARSAPPLGSVVDWPVGRQPSRTSEALRPVVPEASRFAYCFNDLALHHVPGPPGCRGRSAFSESSTVCKPALTFTSLAWPRLSSRVEIVDSSFHGIGPSRSTWSRSSS